MKRLSILLLLCAFKGPGAAGWNYHNQNDETSGKPIKTAHSSSDTVHQLGFPYHGGTRGGLTLRQHPRWGTSIYFSTSNGQIMCSSYSCSVVIRIDDGRPFTVTGTEPADNSSDTVFLPTSIIQKLKTAKRAVVSVTMFHEGERAFTFDVANLVWP
jgi:hypothetical protein